MGKWSQWDAFISAYKTFPFQIIGKEAMHFKLTEYQLKIIHSVQCIYTLIRSGGGLRDGASSTFKKSRKA